MKSKSPTPYFAGIAFVLVLTFVLQRVQNNIEPDRPEPMSIEEVEQWQTSAEAERKALELHDATAERQIEIQRLRLIGEGIAPDVAESQARAIVESRRASILGEIDFLERVVDSVP